MSEKNNKCKWIYEKIYLQMYDEDNNKADEITWSENRINSNDVEYVTSHQLEHAKEKIRELEAYLASLPTQHTKFELTKKNKELEEENKFQDYLISSTDLYEKVQKLTNVIKAMAIRISFLIYKYSGTRKSAQEIAAEFLAKGATNERA